MGGWFESIGDALTSAVSPGFRGIANTLAPAVEAGCLNEANASSAVAALDASVTDIVTNWKPTGYYSPDQIVQITQLIMPLAIGAVALVSSAPSSTSDSATVKKIAIDDLNRKMADAQKFSAGAAEAVGKGIRVVEAPGLYRWVINTLMAVSQAYVTAAVLNCNTGPLDSLNNALQAVGRFLKGLAKIALAIGETILKIPDALSSMWTVVKYGAIAGAAYYVYREFIKK